MVCHTRSAVSAGVRVGIPDEHSYELPAIQDDRQMVFTAGGGVPSGVYQFCLTASSETRPRRTLVRMSSAVAVQTKGLGSLLWASR